MSVVSPLLRAGTQPIPGQPLLLQWRRDDDGRVVELGCHGRIHLSEQAGVRIFGDRLVEAAARSGGRALYAANLAYSPIVQRFVTAARSIGVLQHLEIRALQPLPTWRTSTAEDWGGGASFETDVDRLT